MTEGNGDGDNGKVDETAEGAAAEGTTPVDTLMQLAKFVTAIIANTMRIAPVHLDDLLTLQHAAQRRTMLTTGMREREAMRKSIESLGALKLFREALVEINKSPSIRLI